MIYYHPRDWKLRRIGYDKSNFLPAYEMMIAEDAEKFVYNIFYAYEYKLLVEGSLVPIAKSKHHTAYEDKYGVDRGSNIRPEDFVVLKEIRPE
jgi:hypothetical protein